MVIPALPFRGTEGPLAPTAQVPPQAATHELVDLLKRPPRVTLTKVIRPACQVSVQFPDQGRDRLPAETAAGQDPQLLPFAIQGLRRRADMQIAPRPTKTVAVVPERVAQEVQARAWVI